MRSILSVFLSLCLAPLGALASEAPSRLDRDSGGSARIHRDPLLGNARFVRVAPGSLGLAGAGPVERAEAFFERYGKALGIEQPARDLARIAVRQDVLGHTRVSYEQRHLGLPVFGAVVRAHFDRDGRLHAVHGTVVPRIAVSTVPVWSRSEAERVAVGDAPRAVVVATEPMVFRAGLVQRVPGRDHLVYRVEVVFADGDREFVFVDAHDGKVVERIAGSHSAIHRTVHEPDFEAAVIWDEGDALPYSSGSSGNDAQVNGILDTTAAVYEFFLNLSGGTFPAWDGADGVMHTIWNASFVSCPNATWNGTSTNYCDGVASDDVVAHEWAHAYTESTHGLIYQWQPGALNEAYSDIFGEVIDDLNGFGTDSPDPVRAVGDCSTFGGSAPPSLVVHAPAPIAGGYGVGSAGFNPAPPQLASGVVERSDDGGGGTNGCAPLAGFTAGRIALIDRGSCPFTEKVVHAQNAGAIGVVIVNTDDSVFSMGGSDGSIAIPAVMVSSSDGATIAGELGGSGVTATIELPAADSPSLRWLVGEDSTAFGGAIRDMWNPACKGDPDRVTAPQYWCGTGDSGGVHTNSGVPNHGFALLVDGGTFNGQDVTALGWIKAVHLYWRAMTVYQVPDSSFADHELALLQSCDDLLGVALVDPQTGLSSGLSLTAPDCAAVAAAMEAVEMSAAPPCNFEPLLQPDPPQATCGAVVFADDFEDGAPGWTRANAGVFAEYSPRDWERTSVVPEGGTGSAYFAIDSLTIGNCIEGDDDQSGAMTLDSPVIQLAGAPTLTFDHYVATEPGYDGGNLKVSVNGGPYQLVPGSAFTFNPYNRELVDDQNTNPLAGEEAFSGSDGGVVGGSWGRSHVDLGAFAGAGDSLSLRFELGVDGCNGLDGWYVDNVTLCSDEDGAGRLAPTALLLDRPNETDISLHWSGSCDAGDGDYAVYEGTLGLFDSHTAVTCTTGGADGHQLTPGSGARYYLVVPRNDSREGSYGTDSAGAPRPASGGACLPQALSDC